MRILFIGDIFGKAGRKAVTKIVPGLRKERNIDFVIGNVENLTSGHGVDKKRLKEMFDAGVDVGTGGNHIWQNKAVFDFIDDEPRLVRPANYPEPCPGTGYNVYETASGEPVAVINMLGRVFMPPVECPFRTTEQILRELGSEVKIKILDFHAEATSEKLALARYFDGKLTMMAGTHTHIQTADEQVFPNGTASITDVGMTGPYDSIIGMGKEEVIGKFLSGRPVRFKAASKDVWLHAVLLTVDNISGRASAIERIKIALEN